MVHKATLFVATTVRPSVGLVAPPTARTRLCGIAFLDQHDLHTQTLRFIGEHVTYKATRHLVEALIGSVPMIGVLANVPDVANDDRLHTSRMECGDKVAGKLVQRICELTRKLLKTLVLGANCSPSAL
jgi:hypothetical protein